MDFQPEVIVYHEHRHYVLLKKIIDLTLGSVGLLFATPVLALAAAAIKVEDGGPVFFSQQRVGRFGRRFTIYKLRSMRTDLCGDALSPGSGADARVTRVGRLIRRFSIDELPQLLNVVRGELSLVGPRPEMPFLVEKYASWQHLRHLVMPGLTCIWQVTCRSKLPLHLPEATALDIQYIREASLFTDLRLIARTFKAVLSAHGSY